MREKIADFVNFITNNNSTLKKIKLEYCAKCAFFVTE